jgi:hypothetical protein
VPDPRTPGSQERESQDEPLFGETTGESPPASGWVEAAETSSTFMDAAPPESGLFGTAEPRRPATGRLGSSMLDDLFDRAKKIKEK